MDAHFREYLAAVSGMQETYGEPDDNSPTEFQAPRRKSRVIKRA